MDSGGELRGCGEVFCKVGAVCEQSGAEFGGGAACEGGGEDCVGRQVINEDEPEYAQGEHRGFASAGACDDMERQGGCGRDGV